MRITVGNLKGGVGKTTTALYLAWLLADRGPTLLVDADPLSQSAFDWVNLAIGRGEQWPDKLTVYPWATDDLAVRVGAMAGQFEHLVIDTGGETPRLFRAACSVTDELVIPVAPHEIELRRLPATFQAASEVDAMGHPVYPRVLLTRVKGRAGDAQAARTILIDELDLPVMKTVVRDLVEYSRTHGHVPLDPVDYAGVLAELETPDDAEVPA